MSYVVAAGAVAVVTVIIALVEPALRAANLSMLYLFAVLGVAVRFGRGPAIFASAAAFLAFDWFFIEPRYTFAVADPQEWLSLGLLLVVAIVAGQLAAEQRARAEDARRREREARLLYEVARLLAEPDLDPALRSVAERLRSEFGVGAVAVDVADDRGRDATRIGAGDERLLRAAGRGGSGAVALLEDSRHPRLGEIDGAPPWVRTISPYRPDGAVTAGTDHLVPLAIGDRRVGSLVLAAAPGRRFDPRETRVLSAAAAQIAAAIDRARLRRELTDTEVARRADELKSALLRAVSHDLRTPLASIIASAGSLRQADIPWTEAERLAFAVDIEQEATRLSRIVGNLLDLSRIEGGALRPERGWYDLGALVDDVLGRLHPTLEGRRVAVSVPADLPPLPVDYVEIDQVLTNLIENAVRHTPPESEIEIVATPCGDKVRVEVADRGPGLDGRELSRMFAPFATAPRTPGRGVGLGLAVAKGLVEAHGGGIEASNRPGGGASFAFTLPTRVPAGR